MLRPDNTKKKHTTSKNEHKKLAQAEPNSSRVDKEKTQPKLKPNLEPKDPSYIPLFSQLQVQTETIDQPPPASDNTKKREKKNPGNIQIDKRLDSQSQNAPVSPSIDISRRNTSNDISLKIKNLQQLVYEKKNQTPTSSTATEFTFPREGQMLQADVVNEAIDSSCEKHVQPVNNQDSRINDSKSTSETVAAKSSSNKLQDILSDMQLGRSTLSRSESLDKYPDESNTLSKNPISRTNSYPNTTTLLNLGVNKVTSNTNPSISGNLTSATKTSSKQTTTEKSVETQKSSNEDSSTKNPINKNRKERILSQTQNSSNKSRKLSLKEYKAKKHHGSSSNDEGMVLEFTRLPSSSSISKTTGPIRTEKSSDNAVILVPAAKPGAAAETSRKISSSSSKNNAHVSARVPNEQLASGGDMIGNILGAIQPNQARRQNSTSGNSNNQINNQDMVGTVL